MKIEVIGGDKIKERLIEGFGKKERVEEMDREGRESEGKKEKIKIGEVKILKGKEERFWRRLSIDKKSLKMLKEMRKIIKEDEWRGRSKIIEKEGRKRDRMNNSKEKIMRKGKIIREDKIEYVLRKIKKIDIVEREKDMENEKWWRDEGMEESMGKKEMKRIKKKKG